MKPLLLSVEGLKSIAEEQKIDFESVSKSGIFGVFGNTGSGKSTILDAIVLALYGEVVAKVDNCDFINTGMSRARVELLFSVTYAGQTSKYRVERIYKFGKDRKNLTSSAKLWRVDADGEVAIAENAKPVTEKLENEIIGLKKSDFLKCIALPQGEFSAFVKATRGERLKVIGKLFDLDGYGDKLYRKVKVRYDNFKGEEQRLKGMLEGLGEYSREGVKALKQQLDELDAELNAAQTRFDEAVKRENEAKRLYEALSERDKLVRDKKEKLGYKSVIEGYKKEIELFDELKSYQKTVEDYLSGKKALIEYERQKNDCKIKLEKALVDYEGVKAQKQKLPALNRELTQTALYLEQIKGIEPKQLEYEKKYGELEAKRESYRDLDGDRKGFAVRMQKDIEQAEKYRNAARAIDVDGLLERLSMQVSKAAVSAFAGQSMSFIGRLKGMLESSGFELVKSGVNALIDEEIARIRGVCTEEGGELSTLLDEVSAALKQRSDYEKKEQESCASIQKCEVEIKRVEELMAKARAEGESLRRECDLIKEQIDAVLCGSSYEAAIKSAQARQAKIAEQIERVESDYERIGALFANASNDCATAQATYDSHNEMHQRAGKILNEQLHSRGLQLEGVIEVLKGEAQIQTKRSAVQSFERELDVLTGRLENLNVQLQNVTEEAVDVESFVKIRQKHDEIKQNLSKKCGEIKSLYQTGLKKLEEWCIIDKNLNRVNGQLATLSKLLELVKQEKFMEFIADEYLQEIAAEAEIRLLELTGGRYGLVYEREFFATDNLSGGIKRPVAGLSGGETFLVSLSLALALSSRISAKALRPIDFFFLDEGFGTLDDQLIDVVTGSLEKLQRANLTVGLITHVQELKNRITAKINVAGATPTHGTRITQTC